MKISDLEIGTRIMVTCPRCERKRSLVFQGVAKYSRQKARICSDCSQDDIAGSDYIYRTRTHRKSGIAELNTME